MERIYPSLTELQRNMDANAIQRMAEERDQVNQRTRELEGSLGLALQSINRAIQSGEVISSVIGGDQACILPRGDKTSKSGCVKTVPQRRCCETKSRRY